MDGVLDRGEFLLDGGWTFLNHGSFGACPREVFGVYQDWQRELERQPVEFLGRRHADLLGWARGELGAFLGCDAEGLVFVPNATFGMNLVARSLELGVGDEILTTDHEYGAVDRCWGRVASRSGARVIRAALPEYWREDGGAVVAEAIFERATARTRVISVSHVTSATALIVPVGEVVRRARAAGIFCVVDGAHAPGHLLELDLGALGADVYVGNLHKWLMAPKGAGFLYASAVWRDRLEPLVVSWGAWPGRAARSAFLDELEYSGTRDLAAFLSVPAAIRYIRERDWGSVQARCHGLALEARRGMEAMTGIGGICDAGWGLFRQMVAHPFPVSDWARAQGRLIEGKVELPLTRRGGATYARFSFQGYNTEEDLARGLSALREVWGAWGG